MEKKRKMILFKPYLKKSIKVGRFLVPFMVINWLIFVLLGNRTWGNIAHLSFLHVSKDYRKQGIGRHLIQLVENVALQRGYKRLYVSATASVSTVNFYMNYGLRPTKKVIKELCEQEPNDIHMVEDITKE
jgi:GNAT superfamily N-acetyltransferase